MNNKTGRNNLLCLPEIKTLWLTKHTILHDRQSIKDAVELINKRINGRGFNFVESTEPRSLVSYENSKDSDNILIVIASFDLAYYHDLEILFYDIGYNEIEKEDLWWDHWEKDQLELSKEDFEDGFEFRFNCGTHGDRQFVIRAKGFSYSFDHVNYKDYR